MANRVDIGYSSIIAGILQKDYVRVAISVEYSEKLLKMLKYLMDFMKMDLLYNMKYMDI